MLLLCSLQVASVERLRCTRLCACASGPNLRHYKGERTSERASARASISLVLDLHATLAAAQLCGAESSRAELCSASDCKRVAEANGQRAESFASELAPSCEAFADAMARSLVCVCCQTQLGGAVYARARLDRAEFADSFSWLDGTAARAHTFG